MKTPDDDQDQRRDAMLLRALKTAPESREATQEAVRRERAARKAAKEAAPKDDPHPN